MILGIEATNIRAGGGVTHLKELIENITLDELKFTKIILWATEGTHEKINNYYWLEKRTHKFVNSNFFLRTFWAQFMFKNEVADCDVLFSPGGTYSGGFQPFVYMSQNMLVFDKNESRRFKNAIIRLRFMVLNIIQVKSFKKSSGAIFISKYARDFVFKYCNIKEKPHEIIHHGIHENFRAKPKKTINKSDIKFYMFLLSMFINIRRK